jgi:hypothetical protein
MQFHTVSDLGPKQSLLPSGALLIRDVVIARTGEQLYDPYEVEGADAADDGWVHVERHASEVFAPRSMASFEGMPVVLGHPEEGAVDPSNWRRFSIGHAQNVRRDGKHLVADLLIHDQRGIDAVRNGWRAISAGYDAEYDPTERGQLRQRNITGNHIAILAPEEDARCGDACMIGDSRTRLPMRAFMLEARKRVAEQQAASRRMAAGVREFWENHGG